MHVFVKLFVGWFFVCWRISFYCPPLPDECPVDLKFCWGCAVDDKGEVGPIEADKPQSEVRQVPLNLPVGFSWDSIDITAAAQLDEVYTLLCQNYVEDDDNMFRFNYSPDFLRWFLRVPFTN